MNDLQVALVAAGAAAVAGVWGYNKWQERQQQKLAEKAFPGKQPDALLKGQDAPGEASVPSEPVFREPTVVVRREPVILAEARQDVPLGEVPPPPQSLADEGTDCILRIDFSEPVSGSTLQAGLEQWAPQVGKPVSCLVFDGHAGQWRQLLSGDGGSYRVACLVLQLVDRRGALSDAELGAFLHGVWELASQCSGIVAMPQTEAVLASARQLDEFCASVDLQLGVNIVGANEPLPGPRLKELAEGAGLKLGDDGAFHCFDEAGMTRFTLANIGDEAFQAASIDTLATHGVTLSMDVPRVPEGAAAFDALMGVARPLTDALGGILVDGQGHPVSEEMVAGIRAKITQIQADMARREITAGSARALRLFS